MSQQFDRRKFIKAVTYSGLSIALTPPLFSDTQLHRGIFSQLQNDFFTVSFDEKTGRFSIYRANESLFINNATVRANLFNKKVSIAESNYNHSIEAKNIQDKIGNGKQLIIYSKDQSKVLDFHTTITIYNQVQSIIIEVVCRNVSSKEIIIKSIEPICATQEIGSELLWGSATKVLTNGPMYYDTGMIQTLGEPYIEPDPYGPTKGGVLSPDFVYPSTERIRSWWNAGFFKGYDKEGMVCGFIDNQIGLGQIIISKNRDNNISLYTESVFAKATVLNPGKTISSNKFSFNMASNPYKALEYFSDLMQKVNPTRTKSIVNGWCEWFYTYQFISEDEVIRNAEFASKHLKQFGFEYMQIDEGYQRYHGDWEGNERFPHGMKWLADKIKSYGLKPGLWIAPYIVSEPTEVFQKNPDWFLKNEDNSFMRVGPWPSLNTDWAKNEEPKRYCLDITHPGAAKWFYDLFDLAGNKLGYEMFKIDFVAWSIFSAHHYHERSSTPAQVYRKGFEIIRKAIGEEKHINDCGPGNVSIGYIDSMRIEIDQNYGYSDAAWKQYFLDSSSSAPAAAKRYYFHKKGWINDADHICVNLLSLTQAQAAASIIALSGGNIINGDRLTDLDSSRLEILKKIYPSYGETAKPIDLFDSDRQSIFALKVKKSFDEWTILGVFNPDNKNEITKNLSIQRLDLDTTKTYLVYDFWNERFIGEITNDIIVNINPESVSVLSIHEKKNIPQIISTDRHVLQGAVELENVNWDESSKTLSASSFGGLNTSYNIFIYLPEEVNWAQGEQGLFHDFENYTLKLTHPHILRVFLRFDKSEKIEWTINFNEVFK